MKLRREQFEILRMPSRELRQGLRDHLASAGCQVILEPATGDLILQSLGGPTRMRFGDRGELSAIATADGRQLRVNYEVAEGQTKLVDAVGATTTLAHDRDGRLIGITDPSGYQQSIRYDDTGRPVQVNRPGRAGLRLEYGNTPTGSSSALFDGRGNNCKFDFDPTGVPVRVVERSGNAKEYGYDSDGRLTAIRTSRGTVWRIGYDLQSARRALFFPDGTSEVGAYSGEQLVSLCRRDGSEVVYERGPNGVLTSARYPDGQRLDFRHDSAGRILTAASGVHCTQRAYDASGRLISEEVDGRAVKAEYDGKGALAALINDAGARLQYAYGPDERIREIRDWSGGTYVIERDSRGAISGVRFPNGMRLSRTLDALGLPASDTFVTAHAVFRRAYKYDQNDLVETVFDSERGEKRHVFDAEDRLVSVSSGRSAQQYAYDGHGNIVELSGRRLEYDAVDQLLGGSGINCRYDQRGNLVEWTDSAGTYRLTFNALDRLVACSRSNGPPCAFDYDALGRRISKRCGDEHTTYVWWGEQLIAERVEGPHAQRVDFLYIPDTHIPLAMRVNKQTYFFQTDHLGTPIRLFDASGKTVWAGEPYGYDLEELHGSVRQPLRFQGQYCDQETGLYYNVARYYHPRIGRYISADPLCFEDQTNRYLYAKANPVAFVDPTGRIVPFIIGAILVGALIGAAFAGAKKAADNMAQDKPWHDGVLGAAGMGAAFGAVGGLAIGLGAPVAAVAIAGLAAGPAIAALTAPEGQRGEACLDALPIYGAIRRYDKHGNDAQLGVDLVFDALGLGLAAYGVRAGRGGPPPPAPFTVRVPTMQPAVALPGGGMIPGGIVWEPVTVPVVPATPAGVAPAVAVAPMAMAAASGGGPGGSGGSEDPVGEKVRKSQEAQERASEDETNLPKGYKDKTVSSDDKKTVSGWKEAPPGYDKASPQEVATHSDKIGHRLKSAGANDQIDSPKEPGFPGKYNASHAEKQQAVKNPNEPIGVSKPMCDDCIGFFKKEAAYRGQDQVVTDPEATRIFKPDGTVIEQRPDGSVTTYHPDGSASAVPPGHPGRAP